MPTRYYLKTLFLLVFAVGLPCLSQGQAAPPVTAAARSRPWISAYYLSGDDGSGRLPATAIDFSAITHLIHFGLFPNADGTLGPVSGVIPESDSKTVLALAHAAGCKVIVCMGSDEGGKNIRAALTDAVRPTLVHNLVQFVVSRGYDGLDLDDEALSDADVPTYAKFVPELRAALDAAKPDLLLTAAVGSRPALFAKLQGGFDQINLMTYDNSGPWPGHKTWYNASLYGAGSEMMNAKEDYPSVNETVKQYEAAGIPAAKLGIGVAFYGYIWSGVSGPKQSIVGLTDKDVNDGADYSLIMGTYYQPGRYHWDDQAKAPYLSINAPDPKDRKFISYDDTRLCALKIAYVKQQGLGGVIIWELGGGYRKNQWVGQRDPLLQAVKTAYKKDWKTP